MPYSLLGEDVNNAIYNLETTSWAIYTVNRPSTSNYGTLLSLNTEGNVHTSATQGWIAQLGIGTDARLYLRTKTNTDQPWSSWKEFITTDGGTVMVGRLYTKNADVTAIGGGTNWDNGGSIELFGVNVSGDASYLRGAVRIQPATSDTSYNHMELYPSGTWTWTGQAVQLVSDQRLKQQITQIDNALLDAWEDVTLVQFKYNDAVEQKGNAARLHTGYVVQQINEACQKHNLDISEYGLYCHEEYPERTEEVTIENEDGTTKKETRVIEEASEHYSLRYTETLVVECAYLRRENARLKERLQQHDDYFSNIEKRLQSLENS